MGQLKIPLPVKLICAVTFSQKADYREINTVLENCFGKIELQSDIFNFTHTHYYEKEMGHGLKKYYISFSDLVSAETVPEVKIKTNILEKEISGHKTRTVNLDPGYLEKAKLILVTTKNYSHRIYLGSGIFGDVQLKMKGGRFQPLEWTYPDYREDEIIHFFKRVRDRYCREVDQW